MMFYKALKYRISNLLIIILPVVFFQVINLKLVVSQCYNKNYSFQAGEKLYYHVYYNLGFIKIKLAKVNLWIEETVYNNKKVLVLKNTTATVPEYEWIIRVSDYYASYLDVNTMQVERHIQKTLVNKYATDYEYKFNYADKKLYVSIENSKTKRFLDTLDMKPCLHDLLSAAYYTRNIDYTKLTTGTKISLPVILDTTTHNIYFKYLGNESIKFRNKKKQNCIKISPLILETSIFKSGEKMTVWLSNDKNKVPIIMESELRIGKILVEIVSSKMLRYPNDY